jgi:hypothetical protein
MHPSAKLPSMSVDRTSQPDPATPKAAVVPAPLESHAGDAVTDPNSLTPEEQLARFEQELKETDWGHQPC